MIRQYIKSAITSDYYQWFENFENVVWEKYKFEAEDISWAVYEDAYFNGIGYLNWNQNYIDFNTEEDCINFLLKFS